MMQMTNLGKKLRRSRRRCSFSDTELTPLPTNPSRPGPRSSSVVNWDGRCATIWRIRDDTISDRESVGRLVPCPSSVTEQKYEIIGILCRFAKATRETAVMVFWEGLVVSRG